MWNTKRVSAAIEKDKVLLKICFYTEHISLEEISSDSDIGGNDNRRGKSNGFDKNEQPSSIDSHLFPHTLKIQFIRHLDLILNDLCPVSI